MSDTIMRISTWILEGISNHVEVKTASWHLEFSILDHGDSWLIIMQDVAERAMRAGFEFLDENFFNLVTVRRFFLAFILQFWIWILNFRSLWFFASCSEET